jgi:UDP-N-acetylmuramate-alanine ligase
MHNLMNAAAAIAVAKHEGIDTYLAREALKGFAGTWRRFEFKGEFKGAPVIDDYAHHPTEIKVTIKAARERYPDKKILAIFQPHLHSRLRQFHDDFAAALGKADSVHLLPVYGARNEAGKPVSMLEFVTKVTETNDRVTMHDSVADLRSFLDEVDLTDTLVLVMGAGDVTEFASQLVAS